MGLFGDGFKELKKASEPLYKAPKSIQETIEIMAVAENGIFEVSKNRYSKCYCFQDINYTTATEDEQIGIFERYCKFLNSLDCSFKITINNKNKDMVDLRELVLLSYCNDGYDNFRKIYNDIIEEKIREGRQGIEQERYLTVTIERKNFEEAKAQFATLEATIHKAFIELGAEIVPLSGDERLKVLYDYYHLGDEHSWNFSIKEAKKVGADFKNDLCNGMIKFFPDHFEDESKFCKALFIKKYPSSLSDRFINSLSCLSYVEDGKNLVMALCDAMRFKDVLLKLGFSEDLAEGERILPSMLNPTMKRNAEPFYIKDKTKPKEQYSQTLWWTRHEWAGRGETREVTDFVSIPRERYARIEFEPYSVELFLKYDERGQLIVMTDPISYCQDNEKLLINTINIFLTNFEECEVLTENFENVMPTRIIRLNWEVLPSGDYPWERMQDDLKKVSEKSSKTAKKVLIDKCEFINSFQPDFRAYGKSGFKGYVIFGFTDRDIYVLESVYPNNATYVFGNDWENLSKLTKAEILNGNLQDVRIIHNNNWQQEIRDLLEVA